MFVKVSKERMIIQLSILVWVVICNVVVQLFHTQLEEIGFITWAFFLTNILFFLCEEENMKKRLTMSICGSIFGVLMCVAYIIIYALMLGAGFSGKASIIIPLVICLIIMIVPMPVCPIIFNNFGFAYFTIALISAETIMSNAPIYIVEIILGNLIINAVDVLIIAALMKYFTKKAMAAKAAAEKAASAKN